jgi:methylisocitrate lyase
VDPNEAMRRAKAYVAAGADIIQPISRCFKDIAGLRSMRKAAGVPLSLQLLGWLEKDLSQAEIEEVAGIATYPLVALMSATQAMRENLKVLSETKSSKKLPRSVIPMSDFGDFIGFPRIDALQKKFMVSEKIVA